MASQTVGRGPQDGAGSTRDRRPDDLVALYQAGAPITAIAIQTGIPARRVSAALRSAGVYVQRGQPPPRLLDVDVLTDLYVHERLASHEIARRLGCSSQKVRDDLRRAGIALRAPGTVSAGLADLDAVTLRRLYVEEEKTLAQIAAVHDCAPAAVRKRLLRAGIPRRPRGGGPRPTLDDAATGSLLRRLHLEEGRSIAEIAGTLGWSRDKVGRHLDRCGIPRRPRERPAGLDRRRLRRLYVSERLEVAQIADRLEVSPNHVQNELRRHDIRRSRGSQPRLPGQRTLTPALLRRLYVEQRLTLAQVAEQTGNSTWRVGQSLREAGIALRPRGSRKLAGREPLTAELLQELYVHQGQSSVVIARRLGGHPSRILAALARFNIPTRPRPVPGPFPLRAEELRRLYVEDDRSQEEIASRLDITVNQVRLALRLHHIRRPPTSPPHPPPVAPPPREVLADLYQRQGLPSAAIAARFHTAQPKARAWLADAGIPVAPRTTRETRTDIDPRLLRELYLDNDRSGSRVRSRSAPSCWRRPMWNSDCPPGTSSCSRANRPSRSSTPSTTPVFRCGPSRPFHHGASGSSRADPRRGIPENSAQGPTVTNGRAPASARELDRGTRTVDRTAAARGGRWWPTKQSGQPTRRRGRAPQTRPRRRRLLSPGAGTPPDGLARCPRDGPRRGRGRGTRPSQSPHRHEK